MGQAVAKNTSAVEGEEGERGTRKDTPRTPRGNKQRREKLRIVQKKYRNALTRCDSTELQGQEGRDAECTLASVILRGVQGRMVLSRGLQDLSDHWTTEQCIVYIHTKMIGSVHYGRSRC